MKLQDAVFRFFRCFRLSAHRLSERARGMAPLAGAPKCAVMGIIPAVAGVAVFCQDDLGHIPGGVAGDAQQVAMRASQGILRLPIVIEAPPRPTIGVVARRTIASQASLVMLVSVTLDASQRRIFELLRAMTLLAWRDGVAADQREAGDIVIECDLLAPASFSMALFTAGAELPFVRVVLSVARFAAGCQLVTVKIARVASVALHFRMLPAQRILGRLVVIEAHRLPFARIVAGLALRTISSRVDILQPMTADACRSQVFV